jgi:hypothetical protein
MMLVISDVETLSADVSLAVKVILVAPAFDNLVILDANFQPA